MPFWKLVPSLRVWCEFPILFHNQFVSLFLIEVYILFSKFLSKVNAALGRLHSIMFSLWLRVIKPALHTPGYLYMGWGVQPLGITEHLSRYGANSRSLSVCDWAWLVLCYFIQSKSEICSIYRQDPMSSYFFLGHAIAIWGHGLVKGGSGYHSCNGMSLQELCRDCQIIPPSLPSYAIYLEETWSGSWMVILFQLELLTEL